MYLSPFETTLLAISTQRLAELREVISLKQRRDMTGKEQLIYDTFKLNEMIQKKLLEKQSGIVKHY